jgi:hypothetical protein
MKTTSRLPKFFRRLFCFLEVASPVVGIMVCIFLAALPSVANRSELVLELGPVGLVPEPDALTVRLGEGDSAALTINNLQGTVSVKNPDPGVLALIRWHTLPLILGCAAFTAVLFDRLRRLFRNLERGESFTERSVRLVHQIGGIIIVFSLLSAAATSWQDQAVTSWLTRHATVQGVKMTFATPNEGGYRFTHNGQEVGFHFGGGGILGILTGLLVLSLGEVFRQGLALKKENDLTI